MRLVLCWLAVSLVIAPTASGAGAGWTKRKAASSVLAEAVVRLPAALQTSLAAELDELEYRWLILEATANQQDLEEGTLGAMGGVAHNARYRVSAALKQVNAGLPIADATCVGVGKPRTGRFDRFRCTVVSALLEIPSPEAVWENDRIAGVRYAPPRALGPFRALLDVRVRESSQLTLRQLGESTPASSGSVASVTLATSRARTTRAKEAPTLLS